MQNRFDLAKSQKEEFEDTKGVIRTRKSEKDRQHNGQKSPLWLCVKHISNISSTLCSPLKGFCLLRVLISIYFHSN